MPRSGGSSAFAGNVSMKVLPRPLSGLSPSIIIPGNEVRKRARGQIPLLQLINEALPHTWQPDEIRRWKAINFMRMVKGRSFRPLFFAKLFKIPTIFGALRLRAYKLDGLILDYGLVSTKLVTDDGVDYITDAFQDSVELELMRFHGIGLGSTGENVSDSDVETELTTQYTSDNTRATGSQTENGTNVYQTVGTNPVDASVALREHGLLNNATVASGVLLDRSVYALINLVSGESLQSTYDFTSTSGG